MTSPISPFSVSAIPSIKPVSPIDRPDGPGTTDPTGSDGAEGFAGAIGQAIGNGVASVGGLEDKVSEAATQAAVGNLDSVSDFMIATAEAQLATEITVAVRDRAITAFNDIMRMQI